MPVTSVPVSVEGLPLLELQDLPSFVTMLESYPANVKMTMSQFANLDKADFFLVNTFYKLESEVFASGKSHYLNTFANYLNEHTRFGTKARQRAVLARYSRGEDHCCWL